MNSSYYPQTGKKGRSYTEQKKETDWERLYATCLSFVISLISSPSIVAIIVKHCCFTMSGLGMFLLGGVIFLLTFCLLFLFFLLVISSIRRKINL